MLKLPNAANPLYSSVNWDR